MVLGGDLEWSHLDKDAAMESKGSNLCASRQIKLNRNSLSSKKIYIAKCEILYCIEYYEMTSILVYVVSLIYQVLQQTLY